MGFTGLAFWINAPPNAVELVSVGIQRNHAGTIRGQWLLQVRSYRSIVNQGSPHPPRSMWAVTMNDKAFVLLEDPAVVPFQQSSPEAQAPESTAASSPSRGKGKRKNEEGHPEPHRRNTFVTISPANSLEPLLNQLRARWMPVRQSAPGAGVAKNPGSGSSAPQLSIDGIIFNIGTDWIVRAGNVKLSGGGTRGMLLEAEYLPLPSLSSSAEGASELLSNLLASLFPHFPDSKTVAVTISDSQWEDVMFDGADAEETHEEEPVIDEVYVSGDSKWTPKKKTDWVGTARDKRSSFLIVGVLKSEGIL
ncbi:hypothetical protein SISNIDRAFT_477115 [Sistotremastrum niveocremeum HHB9708]|uniref:Mediator complex subunit 20 n=1 Tax=Sistotremastrum niveocremeum HHB9708 TaxID=1314777 RepID=A0A164ZF86_9AGAM|nr:hypothetical protein SISNIDRAFT_477115 [Sistotremastrum niveocremeum HHB9708]